MIMDEKARRRLEQCFSGREACALCLPLLLGGSPRRSYGFHQSESLTMGFISSAGLSCIRNRASSNLSKPSKTCEQRGFRSSLPPLTSAASFSIRSLPPGISPPFICLSHTDVPFNTRNAYGISGAKVVNITYLAFGLKSFDYICKGIVVAPGNDSLIDSLTLSQTQYLLI